MKIVFATDLHYNFLSEEKRKAFLRNVKAEDPELLILSGDISDGDPSPWLNYLSENLWQDIYFVLGNHDFYREAVADLRSKVVNTEKIRYLTNRGVIHIDDNTSIVGHDGWGDGGNGNPMSAYSSNPIWLRDFNEIKDLRFVSRIPNLLIKKLKELGEEAGQHFEKHLPQTHKNVIAVTHVPPFREANFYIDKPNSPPKLSGDDWLPFFSCKAVGDVLVKYNEKNIVVLCGHTHTEADVSIRNNLRVIVGKGAYDDTKIRVIDTDTLFSTMHV